MEHRAPATFSGCPEGAPPRLYRRGLRVPHRRGVVIIIVLAALALLGAMVFFIINLGRQAQSRVVTQHSADAAAIGGAGWVARSLNTVAMNNVNQTRHIAIINTLEGIPLAAEAALREDRFFRDRAAERYQQVTSGQLPQLHGPLRAEVAQQLAHLRDELDNSVQALDPIHQFFQSHDVAEVTHWQTPSGQRGRLWRAMNAMSDLSEAALDNMSFGAQLNAIQSGRANLAADRAEDPMALMIPLEARLPVVSRTQPDSQGRYARFDDFERPVKHGLLPDGADHPVVARGPFDTVLGFRSITQTIDDPSLPGSPGSPESGGVSSVVSDSVSPFGGPSSHNSPGGGGTSSGRIPTEYRTTGMQQWVNHQATDFWQGCTPAPHSRYPGWVRQMADIRLQSLWPEDQNRTAYGSTSQTNPGPARPQSFALPEWDDDYPSVVPYPVRDFSETAVFHLEIKSRYRRQDPRFMDDEDSWWYEAVRRNGSSCALGRSKIRLRGRGVFPTSQGRWWLPLRPEDDPDAPRFYYTNPSFVESDQPGINVTSLGHDAWIIEFKYQVLWDYEIGISPEWDEVDEEYLPQDAYFVQVILFAGRNMNPIEPTFFDAEMIALSRADNPLVADALADADRMRLLSNPYEGFNRDAPDAPAPVDFDHALLRDGQTDEAALRTRLNDVRRENLTFLAIARRANTPVIGSGSFNRHNPDRWMYALAGAEVFNSHSFDLWTQMWQAQLAPVTNYDDWVTRLTNTATPPELDPYVLPEEVEQAADYLNSLRGLAPHVLRH